MSDTNPKHIEAAATIRDLSTHAVNTAHRAIGPIISVAPQSCVPSILTNLGLEFLAQASRVSASMQLRDAAVYDDPRHPRATAIMHAYADALKLWPDLPAMARHMADSHNSFGGDFPATALGDVGAPAP